ncbi:MAG TPA: hypothetical protein VFJ94_03955 [Intrasporangium sp.]|uniref:hypothetical protein n=1 Tax=Intrasporangium sp. TaxID=1925024 RepID=UPI002D7656BE|nr:hypothetical protein [Intrasporangium sp.]HET7397657.1 hypothetical protein [Intrasporangium sp.]
MQVNAQTGHIGPLLTDADLANVTLGRHDVLVTGTSLADVRRAATAIAARAKAAPRKKARRRQVAASRRNNRKA